VKLLKGKRLEPVSARREFRLRSVRPRSADEPIISAVGDAARAGCGCTFLACESASVHRAGDGCWGGGVAFGLRVIPRHRVRRGGLRIVAACPRDLSVLGCARAVGLLADCGARVAKGGVECHPPRSGCLAKWFQSARLETRTKESDMCASVWVSKTRTRNESDVGWDGRKACTIDRSGYFFDRFE
jgi:hypothetical protein